MKNLNLKIDKEKCVHCGMCVNDCSCFVLEMDENKFPTVSENGASRCMECQHCLAVCPTGALSVFGKNPKDSLSINENHNPENVLNLIQSRKSIRHFKNENMSKDKFDKLQEMLKWVPTGCNDHRLLFSFIDDVDVMNKYRNLTYEKLNDLYKQRPFPKEATKLLRIKDAVVKGLDCIYRGAPHMVVVCSPIDAPCADVDPIIALSYLELYAQSLGIGTLWCGLAYYCLSLFPELVKELKVPEGYKPSYCMLLGDSTVKYHRITQPENFRIISCPKTMVKIFSILEKLKNKVLHFIK